MAIGTNPNTNELGSLDPLFNQPLGSPSAQSTAPAAPLPAHSEEFKPLHDLDPLFAQPLGTVPGVANVKIGEGGNEKGDGTASEPISPMIPAAVGAGLGMGANALETPAAATPQANPNRLAELHSTLEGKKQSVNSLTDIYNTVLEEQNQKLKDLHLDHQGKKLRLEDTSKAVQEAREEAEKLGLYDLPDENQPKSKLRASGPRVEGESGSKNYAKAMAGQEHEMPEKLLNKVTDMTKTSPTGAHTLINKDLQALNKINALREGEFELIGEGENQLMVPKGTVTPSAEKATQAELDRQELVKKQAEAKKKFDLAHDTHQKARIEAAQAESQLKKFAGKNPPELTKAETALQKAQLQAAEIEAKLKAMLNLPQSTKLSRVIEVAKGLSKPLGGAMTLGELTNAIEEFKAGHNKEGALSLLGTAGGALMTSPNPYAKGVGALMSAVPLGAQAYDAYKDYTKLPQ